LPRSEIGIDSIVELELQAGAHRLGRAAGYPFERAAPHKRQLAKRQPGEQREPQCDERQASDAGTLSGELRSDIWTREEGVRMNLATAKKDGKPSVRHREETDRESRTSVFTVDWKRPQRRSQLRAPIFCGRTVPIPNQEVGVAALSSGFGKEAASKVRRWPRTGRPPAPGKDSSTTPFASRIVTSTISPSSSKDWPSSLAIG
jgi:hypothetical protein